MLAKIVQQQRRRGGIERFVLLCYLSPRLTSGNLRLLRRDAPFLRQIRRCGQPTTRWWFCSSASIPTHPCLWWETWTSPPSSLTAESCCRSCDRRACLWAVAFFFACKAYSVRLFRQQPTSSSVLPLCFFVVKHGTYAFLTNSRALLPFLRQASRPPGSFPNVMIF